MPMIRRVTTRVGLRTFATEQMVTASQMKNSKHEFVHFVNMAALKPESAERKEMYKYLNQCFVDNDSDYDGLVSYRGFNAMIDEAALAPRRFGFAPHQREMYKTKEAFDLARTDLFNQLKTDKGRICCETWIKWGMAHVQEKVGKGLTEHKEAKWERSEGDMMSFMKDVMKERSTHNMKSQSSTQAKEFYLLNNQMFMMCDSSKTGMLNKQDFGKLVEKMNAIPKKFGKDWYSSLSFDTVKGKKSGVGLREWLDASMQVVSKHV